MSFLLLGPDGTEPDSLSPNIFTKSHGRYDRGSASSGHFDNFLFARHPGTIAEGLTEIYALDVEFP